MSNRFRPVRSGLALAATALVAGCAHSTPSETAYSAPSTNSGLFGGSAQEAAANSLGVNAFLWRAALDTVSFMPVASADPFGGVILTDWYAPPETPSERFKINIFILDRELRSDGLRADVFRQTQTSDGRWIDAPVDPKTTANFENAILTRARQLRVAAVLPQ